MAKHLPKFQPYKSKKNGQWYFRVRSANGKKVLTGNEGFNRRPTEDTLKMLIRTLEAAVYDYKKPIKKKK